MSHFHHFTNPSGVSSISGFDVFRFAVSFALLEAVRVVRPQDRGVVRSVGSPERVVFVALLALRELDVRFADRVFGTVDGCAMPGSASVAAVARRDPATFFCPAAFVPARFRPVRSTGSDVAGAVPGVATASPVSSISRPNRAEMSSVSRTFPVSSGRVEKGSALSRSGVKNLLI